MAAISRPSDASSLLQRIYGDIVRGKVEISFAGVSHRVLLQTPLERAHVLVGCSDMRADPAGGVA
jgi:hypothetical protein